MWVHACMRVCVLVALQCECVCVYVCANQSVHLVYSITFSQLARTRVVRTVQWNYVEKQIAKLSLCGMHFRSWVEE